MSERSLSLKPIVGYSFLPANNGYKKEETCSALGINHLSLWIDSHSLLVSSFKTVIMEESRERPSSANDRLLASLS